MSNDTECCAAYSDDCKLLAYSSPDGRLKIWDTDSGTLKQEYVPSSHLSAAATCLSWRGQSAAAPRHRKQRSRSSDGPAAASSAPLLALGTPAGSVLVYSVLAGDLQTELSGQHSGGAVHCLAWDTAGQHVFSGAADGHVVQWAVKNGKVKCKLKAGKTAVYGVCPLPDGATLLTAGRTITWWELATATRLRSYPGHPTPVTWLQHVPLPGLDGDGGYFVSAAAAGRVISAWQLTRDESHQTASVSFALSSEPREVRVSRQTADGAVLVTAVTAAGLLHVFERQLNGVRKKPVKPKLTVRVATEGASARPLPVLSARPGDEQPAQLHFCHGSFLRPTFERLPYETDEPSLCLVRSDPASVAAAATAADAVSRVKTPAADGPVRQLAAGLLSTGRKRRTSDGAAAPAAAPAQLPLEQRLGGLVAAPAGRPAAPPSAANMAQLLVQGLASKDRAMLRTVLQTEDPEVISSTVESLPVDAVLPFIDRLGHMLRFADQSFSALKWLRSVMERHSSFLLTQTDLDSVLAPIYSSVQVRLRCYPRLLQLRGRLDLLAGQMAARQRRAAGTSTSAVPTQPLLDYRDDSSDDDGDLLGRPARSPGDVSDMSEDEMDEQDEQPMEDEDGDDGSEDGEDQEDGDELEDGDDSEEDEEDELMNGD